MSDPHDIPLLDHALTAVARKSETAYVEARYVATRQQSLVRDGRGARLSTHERRGVGVRVLADGGEGLGASSDPARYALEDAALSAYGSARASAALPDPALALPTGVATGNWGTTRTVATSKDVVDDDDAARAAAEPEPPALDPASHASLLESVEAALRETTLVCETRVSLTSRERDALLVSSLGASTAQAWRAATLTIGVVACADAARVARSDVFVAQGSDALAQLQAVDWYERSRRLAEEAAILLVAPPVLPGRYPVVLAPDALAVLVHETLAVPLAAPPVGSPLLLDGASVGSALLNLRADPVRESGLGAYGFDDVGRPAEAFDLVREGVLVGRLSDPERPTLRAADYHTAPRPALTNVDLAPGATPVTTLLAEAGASALYLEDPQRWWLSPARDAVVLQCAVARFIDPDGRLGGYLSGPVLEAPVLELWQSLEALADTRQDRPSPVCAGGDDEVRVSHLVPMARFANVFVR